MKHFLSHLDWEPREIETLLDLTARLKRERHRAAGWDRPAYARALEDRVLGLVFFNSSLRTLFSSQAAMQRLGGSAVPLHVGQGTWNLEWRDGVPMNGAASEHVREAVPVLGRYAEALGIRCFAGMKDLEEDALDPMLNAFAAHSSVPVINLESAMEHPCQALADMLTAREVLGGSTARRTFCLTWAPQAKATPMAVPHSAMLGAAWAGMHVRVLHPEGYDLHPRYVAAAREQCASAGTSFEMSNDPSFLEGAEVVYVKSWGRADLYAQEAAQGEDFSRLAAWRVSESRLRPTSAPVLHCLPVRRDVVVDSEVLDSARSRVVDQAENRMWVFMSLLLTLLRPGWSDSGLLASAAAAGFNESIKETIHGS